MTGTDLAPFIRLKSFFPHIDPNQELSNTSQVALAFKHSFQALDLVLRLGKPDHLDGALSKMSLDIRNAPLAKMTDITTPGFPRVMIDIVEVLNP